MVEGIKGKALSHHSQLFVQTFHHMAICNVPSVIWLRRGPQLSKNSLFLWGKQFQWVLNQNSTCGNSKLKQNVFKDANKTLLNHTSAETI